MIWFNFDTVTWYTLLWFIGIVCIYSITSEEIGVCWKDDGEVGYNWEESRQNCCSVVLVQILAVAAKDEIVVVVVMMEVYVDYLFVESCDRSLEYLFLW